MTKQKVVRILFVVSFMFLFWKLQKSLLKRPLISVKIKRSGPLMIDAADSVHSTLSELKFRQVQDLYDLADEYENVLKPAQAATVKEHANKLVEKYSASGMDFKTQAVEQINLLNDIAIVSDQRDDPKQAAFCRQQVSKLMQRYELDPSITQ